MNIKNFDKALLYCTAIIVSSMLIHTIYHSVMKKDIAYIDIGKLVDNYKLKKDLEGASSGSLYKIKGIIDSLKMSKKFSQAPIIDTQIARAEYAFQQYYAKSNQEITRKVWDRLNPVIMKYGEEKHLTLLIGANGAGSLLYADKNTDMTDDLINYVNTKYEKGM